MAAAAVAAGESVELVVPGLGVPGAPLGVLPGTWAEPLRGWSCRAGVLRAEYAGEVTERECEEEGAGGEPAEAGVRWEAAGCFWVFWRIGWDVGVAILVVRALGDIMGCVKLGVSAGGLAFLL